jgi:hypothetical protein
VSRTGYRNGSTHQYGFFYELLSFPSASHVVGPLGTKERLNKVFSLSRFALVGLFAIARFCVRIFVFAAIVLWPWEVSLVRRRYLPGALGVENSSPMRAIR